VLIGAFMIGGVGLSSLGGRQSIGHLLFLATAGMVAGYTVAIRRTRIDGLHAAAIAAVASLMIYLPSMRLSSKMSHSKRPRWISLFRPSIKAC
jgi:drug/metabolite transporter (DMT)-like permease